VRSMELALLCCLAATPALADAPAAAAPARTPASLSAPGAAAARAAAPGGSLSASMKNAKRLLDDGRLEESVAMLEALGPQKSPKTEGWRLNNWGLGLLRKDKAGDAAPILERAVAADSKNFTAWANLAAAYEKIGDKVKAGDTFKRALELLRSENAALSAGKKAKDQEAVVNSEPVSKTAETDLAELPTKLKGEALAAALKQANAMMDAGKFQEAADAYASIGITTPAKREGWRLNNWGLAYVRLGDFDKALPRLKKSVEVFPDNPKAWNNLGVACENLGLSGEAKDAYTRAAGSGRATDMDPSKVELNSLKLDFNAERKKWEAQK
jgi:tetratricopeptide (TPR) repeat protein